MSDVLRVKTTRNTQLLNPQYSKYKFRGMLSLQYSISKEDYVNYYTYVTWDAPENKKKRISYYIRQLVPIIFFVAAFYYTGIFERNSKIILIVLGFIFLTLFLSLINVRSNAVKRAEKIAGDPGNSSIFQEVFLTISETGILAKGGTTETKYQWKAFIKKQESGTYYFLFTSSIQALIIPKRIFAVEEKIQFEKLLSHHLSFDADLGHMVKS